MAVYRKVVVTAKIKASTPSLSKDAAKTLEGAVQAWMNWHAQKNPKSIFVELRVDVTEDKDGAKSGGKSKKAN